MATYVLSLAGHPKDASTMEHLRLVICPFSSPDAMQAPIRILPSRLNSIQYIITIVVITIANPYSALILWDLISFLECLMRQV